MKILTIDMMITLYVQVRLQELDLQVILEDQLEGRKRTLLVMQLFLGNKKKQSSGILLEPRRRKKMMDLTWEIILNSTAPVNP